MISDKCPDPDDMKSEEILGHVYIIYTQSQNEASYYNKVRYFVTLNFFLRIYFSVVAKCG